MARARRHAKTAILPSQNRAWGFYGTVATDRGEVSASREWARMFKRCQKAGLSPESCRDFLDSSVGRHLADAVLERAVSASDLKHNFIRVWTR